jgi:hypothetical protein
MGVTVGVGVLVGVGDGVGLGVSVGAMATVGAVVTVGVGVGVSAAKDSERIRSISSWQADNRITTNNSITNRIIGNYYATPGWSSKIGNGQNLL